MEVSHSGNCNHFNGLSPLNCIAAPPVLLIIIFLRFIMINNKPSFPELEPIDLSSNMKDLHKYELLKYIITTSIAIAGLSISIILLVREHNRDDMKQQISINTQKIQQIETNLTALERHVEQIDTNLFFQKFSK